MQLKNSKEIKQAIVTHLTPTEIDRLIAEVGGYTEQGEEATVRATLITCGSNPRNWYRVAKEVSGGVVFRSFTLRQYEDISCAVETQRDGTVLGFEFSLD